MSHCNCSNCNNQQIEQYSNYQNDNNYNNIENFINANQKLTQNYLAIQQQLLEQFGLGSSCFGQGETNCRNNYNCKWKPTIIRKGKLVQRGSCSRF